MRIPAPMLLVLVVVACGGGSSGGADPGPADIHETSHDATPADGNAVDVTPADGAETTPDVPPPADPGPDLPANTPPSFGALAAITLDQGASTTIDVASKLSDAEDPASALVLSWSAKHVALKELANHVLYVVAPVNNADAEEIVLTVTDTGGLQATSTLSVTVRKVVVDPPKPAECGKVTFSYAAGKVAKVVLLSGTFNAWASTADKADVMTDPEKDGTFTFEKVLAPGVYQYKFIVDGVWTTDPNNPNQLPDGYDGINSVIQVSPCVQ